MARHPETAPGSTLTEGIGGGDVGYIAVGGNISDDDTSTTVTLDPDDGSSGYKITFTVESFIDGLRVYMDPNTDNEDINIYDQDGDYNFNPSTPPAGTWTEVTGSPKYVTTLTVVNKDTVDTATIGEVQPHQMILPTHKHQI